MRNERIAIVGIGIRYPDAASPQELWHNVIAGRRAFRRLPDAQKNATDGLAMNTAAAALADAGLPVAGGPAVDGAASPLRSLVNAAKALLAGDRDVAVAGGVDPHHGLGCGMVVLMREADAIASHVRIYASITGWGVSSDGTLASHQLALTRAYEHAGYGVGTVSYFEGRGAATEIDGLSRARREADPTAPSAALGTIAGTFGDLTSAGMAGLIKAALAVHHQVIPPATAHHSAPTEPGAAVHVPADPALWPADRPVRAGVSATGSGGTHFHIALEEAAGRERRTGMGSWTTALAAGRQDAELLLVDAHSSADLLARLTRLAEHVATLSFAELTDVAGTLAIQRRDGAFRAAVVAGDPAGAASKLGLLAAALAAGRDTLLSPATGVFLAHRTTSPRIAYLFPGQGASPARGGALRRRFAVAEHLFGVAATQSSDQRVTVAEAQPLVVAGSMAGLRALHTLGIDADIAVGHGLGELTALSWGGAIDGSDLLRIATVRGQVMALECRTSGAIAGSARTARPAPAPDPAERLATCRLHELRRPVVSTVTGSTLTADAQLRAPQANQFVEPARFHEAATEAVAGADLAIEVGPGRALSGLVAETAPNTLLLAMDTDSRSLSPLLTVVGAAFALGADVDPTALFADRVIRPTTVDAAPRPAAEQRTPSNAALDVLRRLTAERAEVVPATLTAQTDPLNDLLLSPTTIREIADDASRALGLAVLPATTSFAEVTLRRLAEMVDQPATHAPPEDATPTEVPSYAPWVRPFSVAYVPTARPSPGGAGSRGTWSLHAPAGHPLAERLRAALVEAEVGDGVLLCLPASGSAHGELILRAGKEAALAGPGTRFVVVQQNFGAAGLARTLHLEHPAIHTTVITLADVTPTEGEAVDAAVASVVADVAATTGCTEVRYTETGVRTVPVLRALPHGGPRAGSPLDRGDVLLVTDGAQGIAAECALAMAQDSGASLAIIGSADPGADDHVWHNLARMIAAGVEVRYARADVTSAEDVRHAVDTLEVVLGPVTAVLHGAGRNEPTALVDLTAERLRRTIAPKVDGLRVVLDAVGAVNVKLLVTFGSVIGRAGLRGEAHYATANDWLTELTIDFGRRHPRARALAVEWSAWSDMGEKLGVVEALMRDGSTPISPADGLAALRQVLADPSAGPVVVVGGRMAGLPNLTFAHATLPTDRFVERVLVHYPGVELITEVELSADNDPLIPAALGVAAMTQVAVALSQATALPLLEKVEFLRPIAIKPGGRTTVRLVALITEADTVAVAIRSEDTEFSTDHVRATVCFPHPEPIPTSRVWVSGAASLGFQHHELGFRAPVDDGLTLCASGKTGDARPWAPSLLGPYLERATEAMLGGARTVVVEPDQAIGLLAPIDRLTQTELAASRALGRRAGVRYQLDGCPRVDGAAMSTSHAAGLTVVVIGTGRLACDVAVVAGDPFLGGQQRPVRDLVAAETGEPVSVAAARVLSALECRRKTGLPSSGGTSTLTLDRVEPTGWVVLSDGESRIATWVTTVDGVAEQVVFTVLSGRTDMAAHYQLTGDEQWT